MTVSEMGVSSRFNTILFIYGSIVFYSFLCLVLFVYFGCFGMAGLNLATCSHFSLILFVYGSIVFNSFFCFLLCVYCVCCFGMPAGLNIGTCRFHLHQYFHRFFYFILKTQPNKKHHSDNDDDDEGLDLVPENKPRPPVIVTRESPNSLRANILEVLNGCDIFESMAKYASKRQRGICISSGTGRVRNVSLRQPGVDGQVVSLHGTFEILSLSGSFMPRHTKFVPPGATSLTIFLAGGQGQVVGGAVVGELMAAGPVTLTAASFTGASYERLPLEEETLDEVQVGCVRSGGGDSVHSNNPLTDQSSPNHVQLPVDAWLGDSGDRPPF